jgi:hypothetical protein
MVAKKCLIVSAKVQAGFPPQLLNTVGKTNTSQTVWDDIQLLVLISVIQRKVPCKLEQLSHRYTCKPTAGNYTPQLLTYKAIPQLLRTKTNAMAQSCAKYHTFCD